MKRCNGTTCLALGFVGVALASACGTEPTPPVSVPIAVTVSPPTVSVLTDGSQSFSATVANDPAAMGVSWSITGCSGGASACGSLTNITNNPATVGQLTWSPDGARIAFVSDRDGNFEIYVMRADGSNQVNLSNNTALDGLPAWSPDGTKIAFSSDRDGPGQMYVGPFQIYVMNADGSGVTRLTHDSASDVEATWSPDGSKIAFVSGTALGSDIYVMSA